MANNRIYLRCRGCGDALFLGKSFLGGFYYPDYCEPLTPKLNAFFQKHNYCAEPEKEPPYIWDEKCFPMPEDCDGMDGCFDIVYEDGIIAGYGKEDDNA